LEKFAALKVYNLSSTCILESWTTWRCKQLMQAVSVEYMGRVDGTNKRCCIERSVLNAGQTKDSIELEMQTKDVPPTRHHPNKKTVLQPKDSVELVGQTKYSVKLAVQTKDAALTVCRANKRQSHHTKDSAELVVQTKDIASSCPMTSRCQQVVPMSSSCQMPIPQHHVVP
jgi:hypothetical protein